MTDQEFFGIASKRLDRIESAIRRKCPACKRPIPLYDSGRFYKHYTGIKKCPQSGKKYKQPR